MKKTIIIILIMIMIVGNVYGADKIGTESITHFTWEEDKGWFGTTYTLYAHIIGQGALVVNRETYYFSEPYREKKSDVGVANILTSIQEHGGVHENYDLLEPSAQSISSKLYDQYVTSQVEKNDFIAEENNGWVSVSEARVTGLLIQYNHINKEEAKKMLRADASTEITPEKIEIIRAKGEETASLPSKTELEGEQYASTEGVGTEEERTAKLFDEAKEKEEEALEQIGVDPESVEGEIEPTRSSLEIGSQGIGTTTGCYT